MVILRLFLLGNQCQWFFNISSGQARLDGAFCEHTEAEKIEYLNYLHINGVANIEMESTVFASLTHRAGKPKYPALILISISMALSEKALMR